MAYIIYSRGLNKNIKLNIESGIYKKEDLASMYIQIEDAYKKQRKSFLRGCIFIAVITIVMIVLTVQTPNSNLEALIPSFAFLIAVLLAILLYAYINIVSKTRRQFIKAVKKAYPDFIEEMLQHTR